MKRREFIKQAGRAMVVTGIIAGSGYLLLKPKSEEKCDLDFICQNCKKNKSCSLPEAEDFNKKNDISSN